jgi:DcmR-like sensory protein
MGYDSYPMKRSGTRFTHGPLAAEHAVQLYAEENELVAAVGDYLAAGLGLSEPALVIATPEHFGLFRARLARCGRGELEEPGLLAFRDAEETLAELLVGGTPTAKRFERVVGGLLDELAAAFPGRRPRLYGEMVDLLCARGEPAAAAELEELWNRALERRHFTLLCAYRVDVFDPDVQLSLLPQICGAHTHVRPAGDEARLGRAVGGALEEELGRGAVDVYRQLAPAVGRAVVLPAAERALFWVSANLPAQAERILASARVRYAAGG